MVARLAVIEQCGISYAKLYILHLRVLSICSYADTYFTHNRLYMTSISQPITSNNNIQVSNQVRILGITLDSRLSLDEHISVLSKSCFYHIYALRHIRSNLTLDCSKNIACSLVGCRLDYANSILVGISVKNIFGFNVCKARSLVLLRKRGRISISKTLQELHWLPIKWRINYKVATLTYKLLESDEPT